ncbi:MAG: hypothetical protein R6X02_04135 [Enhygromyxa sp.]
MPPSVIALDKLRRLALPLLAPASLWACAVDDGPPSLDGGDTRGDDSARDIIPLPSGPGCEANWYDIDGGPAVPLATEPEAFNGSLATSIELIEFSGPPHPPRDYDAREVDPVFADLTFEQFTSLYATPVGNQWFVEEDQAMTDSALRALYDYLHGRPSHTQPAEPVPAAANYAVNGFDSNWSAGKKLALTWCIGWIMPSPILDEEKHSENLDIALQTMEWATRAWERASDVNFVHLSEFDSPELQNSGLCQPGTNGIDFRVRTGPDCTQSCGGRTYVEALPYSEFLDPDDVDGTAEIVLGLQRFFSTESEARINALHELGHVMGFTHEHLQFEQSTPACNELNSIDWRGVTPPDPDSVMGYQSCVGINPNAPRLSAWDRLGAYYAYNWSHRRSLMMGAASAIGDYAYDGSGRTGILWTQTQSPSVEVWTSAAGPGHEVEFAVELKCATGESPPCLGEFDNEGRVRPVNAFLSGTAADLDVLFHGPGPVLADSILFNDEGAFAPWQLDLDAFSIPVVGSFTSGVADQILLYRPGPEGDALLVAEDAGLSVIPLNYDGYAYPLAGRYRGFGGGGNDVLWYDPQYNEFSIWQWHTAEPFNYFAAGPADANSLGLAPGTEYVPILGDFNADHRTDIFWYSAGVGVDFMWWSESNQDAVLFSVASAQVERDYRPFVGDFDGNGAADILWFAPYREAVGVSSKIWYFEDDKTFTSISLSTNRDYSPYVADFDDDGCSDILWYQPTDPARLSPIWRCLPDQRDFACDSPVTPPPRGYPVGFGGAY